MNHSQKENDTHLFATLMSSSSLSNISSSVASFSMLMGLDMTSKIFLVKSSADDAWKLHMQLALGE